jgi:hypothetical protein
MSQEDIELEDIVNVDIELGAQQKFNNKVRKWRIIMHYVFTMTVLTFCIVMLGTGLMSAEMEIGLFGLIGTVVGVELKKPKSKS